MQLDRTQLMILLSRIDRAHFMSVTTATETRQNKTNGERARQSKRLNPFYQRVLSVRTSVFQPCYDYVGAVERARNKSESYDGPSDYTPGEVWFEHVTDEHGRNTAFVRHPERGDLYFYGRELTKGRTTYVAREDIPQLADTPGSEPTGHFLYRTGERIPYEAFETYVPPYKPSARQGLNEDEEIRPRTLKIESIRAIKSYGTRKVIEMPVFGDEHPDLTRTLAGFLRDMPDIDMNSIPEQYRTPVES